MRVRENVFEAVQAAVAGPVGNEERFFIQDLDESGGIALGRDVDPARLHSP